jgi:hypothetical protein
MALKPRKKRGPHGEISQLGDWSPVLWRYRIALIVAVAIILFVVTAIAHAL